jgi:type I restriction enzyme, S subunit
LSIRDRTRKANSTSDRIRRAVVAAACSGRLTHDWRERHPEVTSRELHAELVAGHQNRAAKSKSGSVNDSVQQALLESIPSSWSVVRLGDILEVATGATPLRKNSAFYDGGSIPWVTSGAVNGGTITSATEWITPFALEETNVKLFPPGTLLIAMYGEGQTRGRVGELGIEASTNQAVAALLFSQAAARIRPFVRLFFEDSYLRMRTQSAGGVQPNLNLGIIKNTLLPLPPHEEQVEIVRRARAAFKIVDRLAAQVRGVEGTLGRARNSILGKAFRGELVPTEAALARAEGRGFESAEELLARIASREGENHRADLRRRRRVTQI